MKKKVLMLRPNEIDTINKDDIYETCKDLYLSRKKNVKRSCFEVYNQHPLDEIHLFVVRGLID